MPKKTAAELAESREKSNANLRAGGPEHTLIKSGRQAVEKGRKGGIACQKKARELRSIRDIAIDILNANPVVSSQMKTQLQGMGIDPDKQEITNSIIWTLSMVQKGMKGDANAYRTILEVVGQDPKTLIQQEALEIEKEALQQGVSGYSALDDAFGKLGSDAS